MACRHRALAHTSPAIEDVLDEFRLHLRAENNSVSTVKEYGSAVVQLADFLTAEGMPTAVATREHVEA